MATYNVTIHVDSPLSLGGGQGDVNVDSDVIHDEYGMPYFPAKRLRGLLYESAIEVTEMADLCGKQILTKRCVDELFHHVEDTPVRLVIHNFYLEGYEEMRSEWAYIQCKFKEYIRPEQVLEAYTSLRYQTAIDEKTGVAKDHSLRNIRVVDGPLTFTGTIEIQHGTADHVRALALGLQNLRSAGQKRNRGFGKITCSMNDQEKLVTEALKEGGAL